MSQSTLANRSALPALTLLLMAGFGMATAARTQNDTTAWLVTASVLMFACCWASATHLLGRRAALRFVVIAVSLGWFAEQMGSTRGWFFGQYTYTDVLGPRLMSVPVVIPLMWFSLTYAGYVLANLIIWHSPVDRARDATAVALTTLAAAMIVTAFDLGADPYFVYTLKAWIMAKTDGDWFGETVQGFVGWMVVSLAIVLAFRASVRGQALAPASSFGPRHALVPLGLYAAGMVFQMIMGNPVEIRTVAAFAMGTPVVLALAGLHRWSQEGRAA